MDMEKCKKDVIAEYQEKEKQKRELVEKTDYITWLEKFTNEHPSFSDNTWLYSQNEISKEDYANVCKLDMFFSVIYEFADNNYIDGIPCDYGEYYIIEYNGKMYEIGTVIGQGAVSFCNTKDVNKEENLIKFEEIANPPGEIRMRTALIDNQLERIDELFDILLNNKKLNIPVYAIITRANKVLKDIKKKQS